jgi:hypothetical protein
MFRARVGLGRNRSPMGPARAESTCRHDSGVPVRRIIWEVRSRVAVASLAGLAVIIATLAPAGTSSAASRTSAPASPAVNVRCVLHSEEVSTHFNVYACDKAGAGLAVPVDSELERLWPLMTEAEPNGLGPPTGTSGAFCTRRRCPRISTCTRVIRLKTRTQVDDVITALGDSRLARSV